MSVLRVEIVRTGGFAGITRSAQVDDPAEAARIAHALRPRPRERTAATVRDGFAYAITVVTTTGARTTETDDARMDADLRSLIHGLFAR